MDFVISTLVYLFVVCHPRGYRECVFINKSSAAADDNTTTYTEFIADCNQFANTSYDSFENISMNDTELYGNVTVLDRELDWSDFTTPSEEYFL